ncbi:TLC domain-containing protein 4-like [Asterias rubens]|uniref:TLC domain-containing protein 4-like n=1 Tax=Asterias rubens TaxID=7604 RepID=UPI0014551A92|nr:TLC domain-containing protein 4-like [Asterias rubens]
MDITNATLTTTSSHASQDFLDEATAKYLPVVFASFIVSCFMVFVMSPFLSAKYVPAYNKLSPYEQGDWNTRMVSMFHASIVSIISVYNLINDNKISEDTLWGTSDLSRINVCIISGYMMADLIAMIMWFPLRESWIYFLHHIAVLYPFLNNVVFGVLTYFTNIRILAECSTVFVNNRWLMSVLGHRDSKWYMINGITMVFVFFSCRLAILLPYYTVAYQTIGRAVAALPTVLIVAWIPCGFIMDILNLYWFRKMFNGAKNMLLAEQTKDNSDDSVQKRVTNRVKGE